MFVTLFLFSKLLSFPTLALTTLLAVTRYLWNVWWFICDFKFAISSCTRSSLIKYNILLTALQIGIAILRWTIILIPQDPSELDPTINTISTLESIFFYLLILFCKSFMSHHTIGYLFYLLFFDRIAFFVMMFFLSQVYWAVALAAALLSTQLSNQIKSSLWSWKTWVKQPWPQQPLHQYG